MKTLQIIINAENFVSCMSELKKEESNIFLDISKKIIRKNSAKGLITKDRSYIVYSFKDEAEEMK